MDENHHYDLAIRECKNSYEIVERLNIGDIKSIEKSVPLKKKNNVSLIIHANNNDYTFYIKSDNKELQLGTAQTKYLSSEVAEGFTGVIIGLYACNSNYCSYSDFTNFKCEYI